MLIKRGLLFRSVRDPLSRYVHLNFSSRFLTILASWSIVAAQRFYSLHKFISGAPSFSFLMSVCLALFFFLNGGGDRMITPALQPFFFLSFPVHPFVGFPSWRCIPSVTAVWRLLNAASMFPALSHQVAWLCGCNYPIFLPLPSFERW